MCHRFEFTAAGSVLPSYDTMTRVTRSASLSATFAYNWVAFAFCAVFCLLEVFEILGEGFHAYVLEASRTFFLFPAFPLRSSDCGRASSLLWRRYFADMWNVRNRGARAQCPLWICHLQHTAECTR